MSVSAYSRLMVLLALAIIASTAIAAPVAGDGNLLQASPEDMMWFNEARFGMFIHWGPCSLTGKELSWARGGAGGGDNVPPEEYDVLYKRFNPTLFNPRLWVSIAKAAGMKYVVFTTRHHDGFSMFDTQLADYKITNSPFKRDVVAELAEACHEAGMKLGFYYSQPDWYHQGRMSHPQFINYLHGQLRELCTGYGKVDLIWFDGLGQSEQAWESSKLIPMIRRLQPGIIINNRAALPADYDTPEQVVGAFQNTRPWESCITIGTQWGYKPDDNIKSSKQCIRTLVNCAGGDGNLLLNVSPNSLGDIERRQVASLMGVGAWLKKYGETIYGSRGGPFRPQEWGVTTQKDGKIYLHILDWPGDTLILPKIGLGIQKSWAMTGGEVEVRETENGTEVSLAKVTRDDIDTIIAIQVKNSAPGMHLVMPLENCVSTRKPVRSSGFHALEVDWGPRNAVDGNLFSRWATDIDNYQAWLELDLEQETELRCAFFDEEYHRVQEYELQVKEGDTWRTFFKGGSIGRYKIVNFDPVTARYVRFNITKAVSGPAINEFQLYSTSCGEVIVEKAANR